MSKRPTHWQRYWLRNTILITLGGVTTFGLFIGLHNGSLMKAIKVGIDIIRLGFKEHIVEPVTALMRELFEIHDKQEIVSVHDLQTSREALDRMLDDFSKSNQGIRLIQQLQKTLNDIGERASNVAASAVGSNTLIPLETLPNDHHLLNNTTSHFSTEEAMDALMKSYEKELQNPIQGILFGNLMTAMLIQMQKLKVESEGAMLKMDKVLASNQLTMAGTAALPSFFALGSMFYFFHNLFLSNDQIIKDGNLKLRLVLTDVERCLSDVYQYEDNSYELPILQLPNANDNTLNLELVSRDRDIEHSNYIQLIPPCTPGGRNINISDPITLNSQSIQNQILYSRGMLHYNLFRLRQELYAFFALPMTNRSAISIRLERSPMTLSSSNYIFKSHDSYYQMNIMKLSKRQFLYKILTSPLSFIFALMDTTIWYHRHEHNPILSEFNSILKDISELESSDAIISGNRKLLVVTRMRSSYRCFIP